MAENTPALYQISVLLVTYNHEKYIRQALDALFGQVVDGPIELVIADDASSDRTLEIINEYAEKDGRFCFKYLETTSNVGITRNYQRGFAACSGEYVAVLEGDDYWISPHKLQRQEAFLETHWECSLCAVNYFVFDESRFHFYPRASRGNGYLLVTARDMIADNVASNFSTCMYRKVALEILPKELFEICSYDWIVNICVARYHLIGFLEEPMSVYRVHPSSVWSSMLHTEKLTAQFNLIPAYDELTDRIYHAEFEILSAKLQYLIFMAKLTHIGSLIRQPAIDLLSSVKKYLPRLFSS